MISPAQGEMQLDLAPETGGAIARLTWKGRDVLRPAPAGLNDPLDAASFPLVPYANRIANGVFHHDGVEIKLPRNFGDHPHPLHGHGWKAPWRTVMSGRDGATLAFRHERGAWPWAYTAEQVFTLSANALSIELNVRNEDISDMPLSLGFHPYFPRTPDTRLQASVSGVWLSDESGIPTERTGGAHFLDLARGASLRDAAAVDHCHTGRHGAAIITQPDMTITLTADDALDCLHLFVPPGENFFCAEPVSAMPDAFNRGAGRRLAPGESFAVSMQLSVSQNQQSPFPNPVTPK